MQDPDFHVHVMIRDATARDTLPGALAFRAGLCIGCLAMIPMTPPLAAEAGKFSAVLMFSSDYFYRGYSKSNNEPTVRANVDYEHASGFYAGTWLSRVDFADRDFRGHSNVEFYPYLGFNYKLSDNWRVDAIVSRYIFDNRVSGLNSDYNEYTASLHYADFLTANISVADDAYHRGKAIANYEISCRYPIIKDLEISGGAGFNEAMHVLEYNTVYWNLGLTWHFYRYSALDVRYVDARWPSTVEHEEEAPNGIELPALTENFLISLSVGF